jgi:Cu(I)/Ag(I) efflux system membrane fusion protein
MHPDVTSDEPGTCPICGMTLVEVEPAGQAAPSATAERKLLYYRHPHNPQVTSDTPRKDEMGMDFVPVYAEPGASVTLSSSVVQNLGVRTAVAERGTLWRRIDTVGVVSYDGAGIEHLHTRAEGWIESTTLEAVGDAVKKGQLLLELYSPTLETAQQEYLAAMERGGRLLDASRQRLKSLGVEDEQIDKLKQTRKVAPRIRIVSPHDGVVKTLSVREGMYVTPATELVSIADVSRVWVIADVFPRQSSWLAEGNIAEIRAAGTPGLVWEGKIEYVYPEMDARTRTVNVRLVVPGEESGLLANQYVDVRIFAGPKHDIVYVPRDAVISTGKQSRVLLAHEGGRFESREVTPGMESGGYTEIIAGLSEGERVVTSGQFLIDSEASFRASLQRMQGGGEEAEPAPTEKRP